MTFDANKSAISSAAERDILSLTKYHSFLALTFSFFFSRQSIIALDNKPVNPGAIPTPYKKGFLVSSLLRVSKYDSCPTSIRGILSSIILRIDLERFCAPDTLTNISISSIKSKILLSTFKSSCLQEKWLF